MAPTLDDAWAKVEWAHGQLVRLHELLESFHQSEPYLIREEVNAEGTHRILTAEYPAPVPDDVPFVLGDLVHSLHSALDYVVCSFVESNGQTVTTAHAFLIFDSRTLYNQKAPKMLRHVPYEVVNLIESLQPYHERERAERHGLTPDQVTASVDIVPLMRLYRLSIEEKHRALLLATALFSSTGMYVGHDRPEGQASGIGFGFSPTYDKAMVSLPIDPTNPGEHFDPHFASKVTLVKEGPRGLRVEEIARVLYRDVAHHVLAQIRWLNLLPLSRPRQLP